jgi:hypothetical protein
MAFHITLSEGDTGKLLLKKLADGVSIKVFIYDPPASTYRWWRNSGAEKTQIICSE